MNPVHNGFYLKIAAENIKKNSKVYLPFLISCICMVMMTYIVRALSLNSGLSQIPGGKNLQTILSMGYVVISIFSVIFLFYTNSFLMKRRKKEFGVYNILGMEKRHIIKVIFYETLYIAALSILVGILTGIILNKVFVLIIRHMMDAPAALGFELSPVAMVWSVVLFGIIFLLILFNNIRQVRLANPIELLRGSNVGEKEPKAKWFIAVLGLLVTGAGYYLALTIQSPFTLIQLVLLAVLLVISGTYLLFTTGSIAALKILKNNKRYYYRTKHFISVSGMLYRMKKNAVGLANICVMSVGVILLLSIAISLYVTTEDSIKDLYPNDVRVQMNLAGNIQEAENEAKSKTLQLAESAAEETQVSLDKTAFFTYLSIPVVPAEGGFTVVDGDDLAMTRGLANLYFIDQENYNSISGDHVSLNADEVYIHGTNQEYEGRSLSIMDEQFQASAMKDMKEFMGETAEAINDVYYIIVNNPDILQRLERQQKPILGQYAIVLKTVGMIDLNKGTEKSQTEAFGTILKSKLKGTNMEVTSFETRASAGDKSRALRAGVLFVGLYLGILLLMATVLIIYYKQISEAYDDKERYGIMQKVGLSQSEIKKSIRSQILTVFFLPLVVTGIHVAFIFPLMKKFMLVVLLNDVHVFRGYTITAYVLFAIVYAIIYAVTARTYYKIVGA